MATQSAARIFNVGDDFARCFQLRHAPSLLLETRRRPQMAVTRITVPNGLPEPAGPVYPERGFTISVHIRRPVCRGWGTWVDGRFLPVSTWERGGIGIYDLESNPMAYRNSGFDSVHFNLPRATLNAFTADAGARTIDTLSVPQGTKDDFLFRMARFILPWLGDGMRICDLTFEHFARMFCSHVATTYGNMHPPEKTPRGGLAPWQKRRLMDLMEARHYQDLHLSDLAEECGLSVSHFSRCFTASFGVPAHQWLIQHRVDSAKQLMSQTDMSLTEVAIRCGFNDQAAFTHTFRQLVGVSPGRWRRAFTARHLA